MNSRLVSNSPSSPFDRLNTQLLNVCLLAVLSYLDTVDISSLTHTCSWQRSLAHRYIRSSRVLHIGADGVL
jgi:hypothetical protein